ncbi:Protein kinase [Ceratocystis pirilliformis]|uniref:non-specific serine/threonine protein kinase n=1 Tax=Ceratocystis pirilliformis TaxID=259994 RepID=A0ABR3Z873_9PEZI
MQHLAPPDVKGPAHGGFEDEELTISLSPSRRNSKRNLDPNDPSIVAGSAPGAASSVPMGPSTLPLPPPAVDPHAPGSSGVIHDPGSIVEQRIGAYKVIKTLGEGSFGKVKLAIHNSTGQKVALKIIPRKKLISRDMAGRVEREIEYLQLLRHRHIIKLYTVIKTSSEIIMVLEYAGGELFDYIVQHGRMREATARRFFQQMVCAVEYCHRHKIVHRDLKPENLLLDNDLDVKIADFGLSNIMTDGNFLKTSCGSPNYAAPEVISGKLYAGPEVDVWSCGVILYVMLVGRLPFDDDHIPSLFAKITRGAYSVPQWMPSGAAQLIKRMLVVNPVQRISVEEIRRDPWFMENLDPYLRLPAEEFFHTGIDPNKSINQSVSKTGVLNNEQKKLYNEVADRISKTMGYGRKDVEEALQAEEPSAIKDAYLIVRENKLMENQEAAAIAAMSSESQSQPGTPVCEKSHSADDAAVAAAAAAASQGAPSPSAPSIASVQSSTTGPRSYVSKVGILPSSIPAYHKTYVDKEKSGPVDAVAPSVIVDDPSGSRTDADKEETARRLKPHSRNTGRIDETNQRPQGLTPVNPPKKAKPVRWQFGIRSRNAPWEALLCIHKALAKLGAMYIPDENWEPMESGEDLPPSYREMDDGGQIQRDQYDPRKRYKLPADPWNIKVRWETEALRKPTQPLPAPSNVRRTSDGEAFEIVAMFLEIQIYEMDRGVYLVDFKCAGYETWDHYMLDQKDVTSPFPFLDMAARLIMQLAEAD